MALIRQQTDLDDGLAALCRADPEIARIVAAGARPQLRLRAPGFASLLRIIVGQQLSIASADAIWGRLIVAVDPAEPGEFTGTTGSLFAHHRVGAGET